MKKTILILFIIHCSLPIAKSQWVQQNSGTSSFLRDVEFLNCKTGWIVGDNGTILKTTNSGVNWISINNPALGKPLFGIHIIDSNLCYVVGWFETIIKSTDAGNSWIIIRNGSWGSGSSYEAVFFVDENTGWIAGTGQKILRTTNGGDSIITTPLFAGNLHDIYFKDAFTGIVTGSGTDMFKTTNGGLYWNNISIPIGFTIPVYYKLTIVNNLLGWVVGSDNRIFKTTNFGDTWDSIFTFSLNPQSVSMCFAEFADSNVGFVGGEQGFLFKSINGGINWVRENTGNFPPALMRSSYFFNDSLGWIVGGGGKIIYTINGGQTLVEIHPEYNTIANKNKLFQNFPNPFNPSTAISYVLNKKSFVQIKICDISGIEITSLVNIIKDIGSHSINFNAYNLNLSSGIYYYTLVIDGNNFLTKRMILIK